MGNFFRTALRETATNLWRNRLMTMAAILTVTVSLALVGAALYLKQGAAQASASWERSEQVLIFMKADATNGELAAIKDQLKTSPYVQNCVYRDKKWDYAEALRLEPRSVTYVLTVATTPSSYRCTPTQPSDAAVITSLYHGQPGVYRVVAPIEAIHTIQTTVDLLQIVLLVIALILMLSASVLILNSIRMAIFARRREVSVMKLVGATNWFIRVPFVAEGLIQGLIGAFIASLVVYGIHLTVNGLSSGADPSSLGALMRLSGWHVFVTDLVVVVVGGAIGALGSAFAVRRFLDV